jgi:hypothetical protein
VTSSDSNITPHIVGVRSSAEPAADSEVAPGTLLGLNPERQDAFGGPIRAYGGSATGGRVKHALEARSGSSAGALVALRRCRELGARLAAGWCAGVSSPDRASLRSMDSGAWLNDCNGCAPCKGGALKWVQVPVGSRNSNLLNDPDFATEMLVDQRAARPVGLRLQYRSCIGTLRGGGDELSSRSRLHHRHGGSGAASRSEYAAAQAGC